MMKIQYSQLKIDDLDKFFSFFKENVKKFFSDEYTPKTLEYFFSKMFSKEKVKESLENGGYLLLAKDSDKIVGFIYQQEKDEGGVAYAEWLMADKNYHGQGIGSALVKKWEEECIARGVHCIYLMTEKHNIKFYEKCGFTYMGCMPKGWFGAEDNYMYKEIQEPKEENYLK